MIKEIFMNLTIFAVVCNGVSQAFATEKLVNTILFETPESTYRSTTRRAHVADAKEINLNGLSGDVKAKYRDFGTFLDDISISYKKSERIVLSGNELSFSDMIDISSRLSKFKKLKELDLENNNLNFDTFKILAVKVSEHPSLLYISCKGNKFSSKDCEGLHLTNQNGETIELKF